MRTIILAGGYGTRISEETQNKPKPMVLLDDKPILWHVMSIYAAQGYSDFIIAGGYKIEVIEKWLNSEFRDPWNVELFDTGEDTQTGGRISKCIRSGSRNEYFLTYGDGLGNINLNQLIANRSENTLATVTAVRPPARFGTIEASNGLVSHFGEKRQSDAGWINGGFFYLSSEVDEYIKADSESFEAETLPKLVQDRNLGVNFHDGFWQPMDTLREKNDLEALARLENRPWLTI